MHAGIIQVESADIREHESKSKQHEAVEAKKETAEAGPVVRARMMKCLPNVTVSLHTLV